MRLLRNPLLQEPLRLHNKRLDLRLLRSLLKACPVLPLSLVLNRPLGLLLTGRALIQLLPLSVKALTAVECQLNAPKVHLNNMHALLLVSHNPPAWVAVLRFLALTTAAKAPALALTMAAKVPAHVATISQVPDVLAAELLLPVQAIMAATLLPSATELLFKATQWAMALALTRAAPWEVALVHLPQVHLILRIQAVARVATTILVAAALSALEPAALTNPNHVVPAQVLTPALPLTIEAQAQ